MHFALNRVRRIVGFQQHSPNQTSFKSFPPPSRDVSSLYITITRQNGLCRLFLCFFFSGLKKGIKLGDWSVVKWTFFLKRLNFLKHLDTLEKGKMHINVICYFTKEDRPRYRMELTNKTSFKIICELSIHLLVRCCYKTLIFLSFFFLFLFMIWIFFMGTKFPCLNLAKDFSSWVFNFGIFFTIAKNPKIKTQKRKRFRTFIGDIDGLHHS